VLYIYNNNNNKEKVGIAHNVKGQLVSKLKEGTTQWYCIQFESSTWNPFTKWQH